MKHHEASHRGSRFVPLVMAAIQLATWVWVPVIHAGTDVLSTTQHVENSHSNDCSKIHVETWCHTCAASFDLAVPAQHQFSLDHDRIQSIDDLTTLDCPHKTTPTNANGVRGPPPLR